MHGIILWWKNLSLEFMICFTKGNCYIEPWDLLRIYIVVSCSMWVMISIALNWDALHFLWYCRALVEIKPILHVTEDLETESEIVQDPYRMNTPNYRGFQHADWHDSCLQKCVIGEKICAMFLSITGEVAANICSEAQSANHNVTHQTSLTEGQMERISQFCMYLLNKTIIENNFSWGDVMVSFITTASKLS